MLRAVRAADLSEKDKFEEVAKEWSALAEWADGERRLFCLASNANARSASRLPVVAT
jgi:hypothetical protein